jgi:hypothetical protein
VFVVEEVATPQRELAAFLAHAGAAAVLRPGTPELQVLDGHRATSHRQQGLQAASLAIALDDRRLAAHATQREAAVDENDAARVLAGQDFDRVAVLCPGCGRLQRQSTLLRPHQQLVGGLGLRQPGKGHKRPDRHKPALEETGG